MAAKIPANLDPQRLLKTTLVAARPSGETFDCKGYAKRRLGPQLSFANPNEAPFLELHLGTIIQTEELLRGAGQEGTVIPDKTSPETWLTITAPGKERETCIISNILGFTRLRHFLAMLKLTGFPPSHLTIYDFQNDYAALAGSLWGSLFGQCQIAVFAFNPQGTARSVSEKSEIPYQTYKNEFMEFCVLPGRSNVMIFNLQYVYGSQIAPFLYALLGSSEQLRQVVVMGAAGGIDERLELNDLVCFRRVLDHRKKVVSGANNYFSAADRSSPAYNLDVISTQTMFAETMDRVAQWRGQGIGAVELELSHAAAVLKGFPGVQFGAVLKIADLPGKKGRELAGRPSLGAKDAAEDPLRAFTEEYLVAQLR